MPLDVFVLVLALLALGVGLARTTVLPANTAEVLNAVVLYVCLPAAVLRYTPALQFEPALIGVAAAPWGLAALAWALAFGVGRLFDLDRAHIGAWAVCVGLCNSSFLGFPLVRSLLGEQAVKYAVVYDQLGSFLLLSSAGVATVAWAAGGATPDPGEIARRLVRFPAAWALLVGVTIWPESPPAPLAEGLQRLTEVILPLVLLAVGFSLRLRLTRAELGPVLAGLAVRLVGLPLAALAVGRATGMPVDLLQVTVLESAMPSMVSAAALAMASGLAPRLCAALVGYGIAASMITLPIWAAILT